MIICGLVLKRLTLALPRRRVNKEDMKEPI